MSEIDPRENNPEKATGEVIQVGISSASPETSLGAGQQGLPALPARYSRPEMRAVWSEENKIRKWLDVELAVVEAWAEAGVVPQDDLETIRKCASATPSAVAEREAVTRHDLAAFVDVAAARCGPAGRWIHFGLTSSDVLDTALALQLREATKLVRDEAVGYFEALKARALEMADLPCVGRTHGIHAEPTTFGVKLASFAFEALRFIRRLDEATSRVLVGKISGAVGTYSTVPPRVEAAVLARLGLAGEEAPTQVVARDRVAEYLGALALGAAAVERFATEIRHLQRTEVGEAEEPFAEGQKGSSAMPHKKNPVISERLCGLSRVVRSAQTAALEDVALWHERDISHSSVERVLLPLATATLHFMLTEASWLASGLRVNQERMRENLELTRGAVFSQRLLLALVRSGLERDRAYRIVQATANRAALEGRHLREVAAKEPEVVSALGEDGVAACFDLELALAGTTAIIKRLAEAKPPKSPF